MSTPLNVKCLIFSKDRAAQLLLLLESLTLYCDDWKLFPITVLYKVTTERDKEQYEIVQTTYPSVNFKLEQDLRTDFYDVLKGTEYILFFTDDSIATQSFSVEGCCDLLHEKNDALGFSLRLGTNIFYCYPYRCVQKVPRLTKLENDVLEFDWSRAEYDFAYPLEVSSSIFRTSDILASLDSCHCNFSTVNHIESFMAVRIHMFIKDKPNLLCYDTSRAFANPLNIVTSAVGNRFSTKSRYEASCLSDSFEKGYKIDISPFLNFVPIGCHQEVDILWVER